MRPIQPGIESVELFWKDHDVPIVRFRDQADLFHVTEVLRFGQRDPHAVARVGAVGDEVFAIDLRDARVFHAEFLILGERALSAREPEKARDRP